MCSYYRSLLYSIGEHARIFGSEQFATIITQPFRFLILGPNRRSRVKLGQFEFMLRSVTF